MDVAYCYESWSVGQYLLDKFSLQKVQKAAARLVC